MRLRTVLTAVTVVAALAAPATHAVATAAKKPVKKPTVGKTYCNLMVDPRGDGQSSLVPVVKSSGLDILGGDIATGNKTMVAVLRLASTDFSPTSDPYSTLGYNWVFATTSTLGQTYSFTATLEFNGTLTWGAAIDGNGVPVSAKVVGNDFQWTIQRKDAPNLARPKNVFHNFSARSSVLSSSADGASDFKNTYPDKAKSCVLAQ